MVGCLESVEAAAIRSAPRADAAGMTDGTGCVKEKRGAMAMKNASNLRIKDVMTPSPACCVSATPLQEVAMLVVERDCGAIPVVDDRDKGRPVGIVTDRDIASRMVAAGRDALQLTAGDCMSTPCVTAGLDLTLEDCC